MRASDLLALQVPPWMKPTLVRSLQVENAVVTCRWSVTAWSRASSSSSKVEGLREEDQPLD
jgi:hypothetical protein